MDRLIETMTTFVTSPSELTDWKIFNLRFGLGMFAVIETIYHIDKPGFFMKIVHYERRDWIEKQMEDMEVIPIRRAPPRVYTRYDPPSFDDPNDAA